MTSEEIYKLIKEKEVAIRDNLLTADELDTLKKKIEEFLDINLKEGSLLFLRYRKFKDLNRRPLWKNATGKYPIESQIYINPWIEIFEQYLGEKKIKRRIENEGLWVQSTIEEDDIHIFTGERDGSPDKVHLVLGKTGEIRIDSKDQTPHDILEKVEAILKTKRGEKVRVTRDVLEFLEDDESFSNNGIAVYSFDKGGYFSLEFYNFGNEDVLNFRAKIFWTQRDGQKERDLKKFFNENDNPALSLPSSCNVLRKGEKKYSTDIPLYSLGGIILVKISGIGAKSKKELMKEFKIKNEISKE